MTHDEAVAVIKKRNSWYNSANRWYRFTDWITAWPYIWKFGLSLQMRYRILYPDEPIDEAIGIIMASPISRRIGYEDVAKNILSVKSLK